MKALCSEITIGKYTFTGVFGCAIEKTTRIIGNTATIELPLCAVFENTTKLNIANEIKRGDDVVIKLGYDGELDTEFVGFVLSVAATDKTVIKCEDKIFKLRTPLKDKLFKKDEASLSTIIDYIIKDSKIALYKSVPKMNIESFIIKGMNAVQALQKIKDEYGITAFITSDEKLFVGLIYTYDAGRVSYDLQKSVHAGKNNLEFKAEADVKIKIEAISKLKDNKELKVTEGDTDGELRTLHFKGITDESKLKELAKEEIKKYKYTGCDGTFTGFGYPIAQPGMSATITDNKYPAREGIYYIESVKVNYGNDGFNRVVELGVKL